MALKDLFTEVKYQYLASTSLNDLTGNIESADYIHAYLKNKKRFVPLVNYSKPEEFARFGSAEKYYYDSITRTYQTYPYDGSLKEKIVWELSSSYLDLYLLDNGYPRTTGYVTFSTSSLAATDTSNNYGAAGTSSYEYIFINGGPHAGVGKNIHIDPDSGKAKYRKDANIWDTGKDRECNLKIGGIDGNTVEFWLKKEAFDTTSTKKEVILDIHTTSSISSSADYGRLRIEMTGTAGVVGVGVTPFLITYMSGTTGFVNQSIGSSITTSSIADDSWHHYAFRFKNTGSNVIADLFIDGTHNDSVTAGTSVGYVSGTIVGTLASLATYPSGTQAGSPRATKGWGKLSGSIDEFRYWKIWRNSEQIQTRWFDQVGGGTNTDASNTDLGVYFKFNEGITLTSSIDEKVLDYSGRISNGAWTGYITNYSRNTGSAIDESAATNFSGSEFKDPIIYFNNPDVRNFLSTKRKQGKLHDYSNPSNLYYSFPSWILEEHDANNPDNEGIIANSLWNLTQIISAYFDDAANKIKSLPNLAQTDYFTGSLKPIPFMDRILESKNFISPEVFSALDALEEFENRDNDTLYTEKIYNIKNIIYKNIYNNLTYIYKSKGTEKSFRNLVRCFGIDDEIYKFNVYPSNVEQTFKENYRSVSSPYKIIDFSNNDSYNASIYQYSSSLNTNSTTFISASENFNSLTSREAGLSFGVEANIVFPNRVVQEKYSTKRQNDVTPRDQYPLMTDSSLFGLHTAITATPATTTWATNDYANFIVKAIKPDRFANKCYFVLTGTADGFIPLLTSSQYNDVYTNTNWSFLVSLYPQKYKNINQVAGTSGSIYGTYVVEFAGVQSVLDTVINEFKVTGSMSADQATKFLASPKRCFVGAHTTNFTGSVLLNTDIQFNNFRVWQNRLTMPDLKRHAGDPNNYGITNPEQNAYLFNTSINHIYVPNKETLLLHWDFDNITGSDSSGEFIVDDLTSGSANQSNRYGWLSNLKKEQFTGKGYQFLASSTDVIKIEEIITAKPNLPEVIGSDDMITVMQNDDIYFTRDKRPIFFDLYVEKSLYQNISEEMMDFLATAIDFNNLIGHPVDKYRPEYKSLGILRQLFFQNIENTPDVDKYIEYFKWFDLAIGAMIQKLAPMSSGLDEKPLRNVIESHILERNKYQNKFPSYEFKQPDPEGRLFGINEMLYNWKIGHAPVDSTIYAFAKTNCFWWAHRAQITGTAVDVQRNTILDVINNENNASAVTLSGSAGSYEGSTYALRNFAKPYKIKAKELKGLHGGVNFERNKDLGYWDPIAKDFGESGDAFAKFDYLYFNPANTRMDYPFAPVPAPCNDDSERENELGKEPKFPTFVRKNPTDNGESYIGYGKTYLPFNVLSSSQRANGNGSLRGLNTELLYEIDIVNLHNDTYGYNNDVPMQGPFTNKFVGGKPHRHFWENLRLVTDESQRPESFRLSVGFPYSTLYISPPTITTRASTFDMKMRRSVYYRDETAKRPVNIANHLQTTGSGYPSVGTGSYTVIGNYSKAYEIVHTSGRTINNRYFIKAEGDLPTASVDSIIVSGVIDYTLPRRDLTGSKFIFVNRFSSPGDPSTMAEGMLNVESGEYSIYNALPFRNLLVREPLRELYSDHCKQFGYFSDQFTVAAYARAGKTYPGGSSSVTALNYDGTGSFHKVNRNTSKQLRYSNEFVGDNGEIATASIRDNWFVQHQIPQSDIQYAWITASIIRGYTGSAAYGFEQPDWSHAGRVSTDLSFVTASDYGSYLSGTATRFGPEVLFWGARYWGIPTQELTLSAPDRRGFVPTDFAGINSNIYEILTSSENHLGYPVGTQIAGGAGAESWAYLHYDADYGRTFINSINSDTSVRPGATTGLNSLILHRQGPYGWPIFKQIRGDNHPIVRTHKNENRLSYLEPNIINEGPGIRTLIAQGLLSSAIEPMITSKFKPIAHKLSVKQSIVFGAGANDVEQSKTAQVNIVHTYMNNKVYFTDHSADGFNLNSKMLDPTKNIKTEGQTLDAINYYLYTSDFDKSPALNPIKELISYTIKETVFPKGQFTYLNRIRGRELFTSSFWRATHKERLLPQESPMFDPPYQPNSVGELIPLQSRWALDGRYPSGNFATAIPETASVDGSGELLSNGAVYGASGSWEFILSPLYTLPTSSSGLGGPVNDVVWDAGYQSGLDPFASSYATYALEMRNLGKDYSIIPEFRISEYMSDYVDAGYDINTRNPKINLDKPFLSLTGTALDATDPAFYKIYTTSDFLKYFSVRNEENDGCVLSNVKIKCKSLMKFLPYDGFYPAQRSLQLATLFSQSMLMGDIGSGSARAGLTPFYAPGIMYNSIKAGLAVDFPMPRSTYHTGTNGRGTGYYKSPQLYERVPFEAILDPRMWKADDTTTSWLDLFIDTGSTIHKPWSHQGGAEHGTSYTGATYTFKSTTDNTPELYRLAANNFFAETINFFLPGGRMTSLVSLPAGSTQFGQNIKTMLAGTGSGIPKFKMKIFLKNTANIAGTLATGEDVKFYNYKNQSTFGIPAASAIGLLTDIPDTCVGAWTPSFMSGRTDSLQIKPSYGVVNLEWNPISPNLPDEFTLEEILSTMTSSMGAYSSINGSYEFMNLTASINITKGRILSTDFDAITEQATTVKQDPQAGEQLDVLIIEPKWECPQLNFANVVASHTFTEGDTGRIGMWHQQGKIDEDVGVYLTVSDPYDVDGKTVGSLADLLGFDKTNGKTDHRLGKIASTKDISEAVVAIPYRVANNKKITFKISRNAISQAELILDGHLATMPADATNPQPDQSIVDMVRKMREYVVPPHLDFVKYQNKGGKSSIEQIEGGPFAMYIFEFKHTLTQQDLANIWQNLPPISMGSKPYYYESDEVEISHKIFNSETLNLLNGKTFLSEEAENLKSQQIVEEIQWMVFKIKKRATTNYFDKTTNINDGAGFNFRFKNQDTGFPEITFNWPYDYFSMVELVQLETGMTMAPMDGKTLEKPDDGQQAGEFSVDVIAAPGDILIPPPGGYNAGNEK